MIDWPQSRARVAPVLRGAGVLPLALWRFATAQRGSTTLLLIAGSLPAVGGVPPRVLADRMACPKGASPPTL